MNSVNYEAMSDPQLKRYMLEHREDLAAFYAYVDRSRASGRLITIDPTEPNWEEKTLLEIQKQLDSSDNAT